MPKLGWDQGLCCAVVALYGLLAITAPYLGLTDPNRFLDLPIQAPPSAEFWWGTTRQGYDVLARVVFGCRTALQVILSGTLLSAVIGVPLGLLSGYVGDWLDRLLIFTMDILYTLPGLLLAIAIAFVLGPGLKTAAVAIAVAYVPLYFRVVRNQTTSLRSRPFVVASIAAGAGLPTLLRRHLLPNVMPSLPVLLTLNAADAILISASLGFLGLGFASEVPEWGQDLRVALESFADGSGIWWPTVFPGLAIAILVMALSWLGESIEDRNQI